MEHSYDYIIVGAGSAGCVIADELSSNPKHSVLVIESGPSDKNFLIDMPRGIGKILSADSPYVWSYDIDRGAIGGSENWLKGHAIGGSSSINGMIYARGFAGDYDRWQEMGCTGWGWKDLSPHFIAHENHELGRSDERGSDGPLRISAHPKDQCGPRVRKLTDATLAAMQECGTPTTDDTNSTPEGGAGYQPRTIYRGKRQSAAKAFLHPAAQRPNLTVISNTQAKKIIFKDKKACAVEVSSAGNSRTIQCNKEIILSAGAIESPKLLQLSGVGPADLLISKGIPVIHNAPEVGKNLQEHFYIQAKFQVTQGSLNKQFGGLPLISNVLRYLLTHKGPMTHAAQELIAYIKTDPQLSRPDCQLGVGLYTLDNDTTNVKPHSFPGLTIGGYPMHPKSRGELSIRSSDPSQSPQITANYLQEEEDQQTAIAMLRTIRKISEQPALQPYLVNEIAPGKQAQSDEDLLEYYKTFGGTAFHVASTCRMGADENSVVDLKTRVRGVEGLRVIDTSIFPELPSGNTNAPVMAVARHAAKMING